MCRTNLTTKLPFLFLVFFLFAGVQISRADGHSDPAAMKIDMQITEGLGSPIRIAINSGDIAYVTDAVGGKINKYDSNGNLLAEFAPASSSLALAVTSQGQLYVTDRMTGELQLLDANGNLVKTIADDFALPSSAIVDDEGRLYVVDGKKKSVRVFDTDGNELASFGQDILFFPTAIAFDQKNQRLLVAEHGGLNVVESPPMIHAFDKQGVLQASFGLYGYTEGRLTRIQGMAVDQTGRIYVADTFQGVVSVLTGAGDYVTQIGEYGTEPGQLRAPMGVAFDSQDRLWVCSMNNGSLDVFDVDMPTDVADDPGTEIPSGFELRQNYPNPFNPSTQIPFVLAQESQVVIHIYNEMGQRVRTFDLGRINSGERAIMWDATNSKGERVSTGVYLYEIRTDGFVAVRRMLLLK